MMHWSYDDLLALDADTYEELIDWLNEEAREIRMARGQ